MCLSLTPTKPVPSLSSSAGFTFVPARDILGWDLQHITHIDDITVAFIECFKDPLCKAFTTNMHLKYWVPVNGPAIRMNGTDQCAGIYVKPNVGSKCAQLAGYTFHPQKDVATSNDIKQLTGGLSLIELYRACIAAPGCKAFNTAGDLKFWVQAGGPNVTAFVGEECGGIYVREGAGACTCV